MNKKSKLIVNNQIKEYQNLIFYLKTTFLLPEIFSSLDGDW